VQTGRRLPWVTFAVVASALAAWLSPAAWQGALAWDRAGIRHWEIWRLWTGHLVHFSAVHLAWNLVLIAAAGIWIECAGFRGGRWLFALAPPCIGIALLAGDPRLDVYGGLSGLATACVVFACVSELSGGGALKALWWSVLAAIAAKIGWEFFSGSSLFAHFDGASVRPVPLSHLAGACVAAAFAIGASRKRR